MWSIPTKRFGSTVCWRGSLKASKTGLVILMFVLMAIILMVAFGGKPYGPSTAFPSSVSNVTADGVALRKPLSPESSALISNTKLPPPTTSFVDPVRTGMDSSPADVPANPAVKSEFASPPDRPTSGQAESQSTRLLGEIQPMDRPGKSVKTAPPSYRPPRGERRYHRVIDGDTLPSISETYFGSAERYLEIFEANRAILIRPDVLPLGSRLEIPWRREPSRDAPDISPVQPRDVSGLLQPLPPGWGPTRQLDPAIPLPTASPFPTNRRDFQSSANSPWRSIRPQTDSVENAD